MTRWTLVRRSLGYHWRTNVAVVAGVTVAVSVLAGALLVGDSVRGSLRDLLVGRLGRTAFVMQAPGFVREALAADLRADPEFAAAFDAVPLVALDGFVVHEPSERRVGRVGVFGVDERFWAFHQREALPMGVNEAFVSEALARALGAAPGDSLLIRVEQAMIVPAESLYGRKDDVAHAVRVTIARVLGPAELGEFSLRPAQGAAHVVFVPLLRLQRALQRRGEVNTILVSAAAAVADDAAGRENARRLADIARRAVTLKDIDLQVRALPQTGDIAVEQASGLLDDAVADAAARTAAVLGLQPRPVFSYLANTMRAGDRTVPYSIVTALDLRAVAPALAPERDRESRPEDLDDPPIVLGAWAARELDVREGGTVWLSYYLWEQEGSLGTEMARFRVAAVVPVEGLAADRDLVPEYPGISGAESLADWDPPFPIDLGLVRPADEEYWRRYRTAPKAFIPLEVGQRLWQSRHGRLTSMRAAGAGRDLDAAASAFRDRLRAELGPEAFGLVTYPVRAEGLDSARGATDFGEYFTYFSFFIVVSALLLASLFFRLGVEQRAREIGILRAGGYPVAAIRRLFLQESLLLASAGGVLGMAGAVAYGALVMHGLRTWWVGAVGTTALALHVEPLTLVAGGAGGVVAAAAAIALTLRRAVRTSPRGLLAGRLEAAADARARAASLFGPLMLAAAAGLAGISLAGLAAVGVFSPLVGFFVAGTLLLLAALAYVTFWLRRRDPHLIEEPGLRGVSRLGLRNATDRPGRSVLAVALIASATFIIVAVDAFRRGGSDQEFVVESGTGGYPLVAESLVPILHDLDSVDGRRAVGLDLRGDLPIASAHITALRLRPGEDASCLNLYRPRNPRILGVPERLVRSDRFRFAASLAETPDEVLNPWLLLERDLSDDVVPVIADANSMTYVLHVALGDELSIVDGAGRPVTLRFVGALDDSIFQSELLMAERHFTRLFPQQQGYRLFLIDVEPRWAPALSAQLEKRLGAFGVDVESTAERLASFHQVENTYLSTFQTLGAFGLLLGTFGLAAVMVRNVLERRRELALLRAVGYHAGHLSVIILAESALLLCSGLVIGAGAAAVAIAPALLERGGQLPGLALLWLLAAVAVAGVLSSAVATTAAVRAPLLEALRTE